MAAPRPYDVVLFGATGFTGQFAYEHLISKGPLSMKLAIAGRSRTKLEAVRDAMVAKLADGPIKTKAQNIAILIADSHDETSLDTVVSSTKVILSTVGPFMKYGKPLIDSCIRFGTDYVDSTGEGPFIRHAIDTYEQTAIEKRVRIVPSCGFDSLPSDVGTLLIADYFAQQGKKTASVRTVVEKMGGGISGGTIHTMAELIGQSTVSQMRESSNPYLLVSKDEVATRPKAALPVVLEYNKDLNRYETIFVMAPGNTAYVLRSFSLLNRAYGSNFRYTESLGVTKNFFSAAGLVLMNLLFMVAVFLPPTRWIITSMVPPGTNTATEETLRKSKYVIKYVGTAEDGSKAVATFKSPVDLGYVGTGIMLAESAMCLALDGKVLDAGVVTEVGSFGVKRGGILTASTAMGLVIVERLRKAGMEITVEQL
ncbi:hypothetical protein HDU98_012032 [Podochytrium sp. JEL0797]|nr:hypothetical protein HDU98_012032 [Podochytrium sp. JEL0797]